MRNPLSDCYKLDELAEALGRNPKTLQRWTLNGLGPPHVRVGSVILYRKESLKKWLKDREVGRGELYHCRGWKEPG